MKRKKQKISKKNLICVLVGLLALAGILGAAVLLDHREVPVTAQETEPGGYRSYVLKPDLETFLIMGLDKFVAPLDETGYINDQQCDFLLLLVLNHETNTCDFLHLNRDTMTEITRIGVGGGNAGRFEGQLALAHTYGSGGSDSAINTTKAVSHLLKGAPIDHYLAMTMDAVPLLNDLLGGVTVKIPVDMTSVDPAFKTGAEVKLQGEQALQFIRARGSLADSSNLSRMDRQRQFLSKLFDQIQLTMDRDSGLLNRALLELSPHFRSDLSINQIDALGKKIQDLKVNPFKTLDGKAVKGEKYMEFYVDPDALDRVLLDLFYEPAEN